MPLSPHLPIYGVQITSLFSILHRLSELALYGLAIFIVSILLCCALCPQITNKIVDFIPFVPGILVWVIISFILSFYIFSSLRYLGWDLGLGFSVRQINCTGWIALIMTSIVGLIPILKFLL